MGSLFSRLYNVLMYSNVPGYEIFCKFSYLGYKIKRMLVGVSPAEYSVTTLLHNFIKNEFRADASTDGYLIQGLHAGVADKVPDSHRDMSESRMVEIINARPLLEQASSKAEFFKEHGFVLLNKPTNCRDWNTDYAKFDSDVSTIYRQEIDDLIRNELFDSETKFDNIIFVPAVLRRGRKSNINFYAHGIHQDYGSTPEDWDNCMKAYGANYSAGINEMQSRKFMSICFWRPINLGYPLLDNPLAVCDPTTVKPEEVVPTKVWGYAPCGAQPQLMMKFNKDQKWYYFPDMTNDEILAFKQYEFEKPDGNELRTCFHTAFKDPRAGNLFSEKRQSTEYRVQLYLS